MHNGRVFQHDNDPKHTSKSTKQWLHQRTINVVKWPSQTPNINLIENRWGDVKKSVHRKCPHNLTDLENFSKEEWAKIAKPRCAKRMQPRFA
uniref:Tc1-like transposase DDE domain-containing protein n=1 Tax=Xenopus tropicalis TaxID=8364 RepID=A0A803JCU5_XENTR